MLRRVHQCVAIVNLVKHVQIQPRLPWTVRPELSHKAQPLLAPPVQLVGNALQLMDPRILFVLRAIIQQVCLQDTT